MNKYIILLSILGILLIIIDAIMYIEINNNDNLDVLYINGDSTSEKSGNVLVKNEFSVTYGKVVEEDKVEVASTNTNISNDLNNANKELVSDVYNEEDVVGYFENIGEKVSKGSTIKEYFITVVDFIFYDKEINGYIFEELNNIAKVKIVGVALKIDSKMEEYITNYKETISDTSSDIYNNVKEKLVILYMDISIEKVCKNGQVDCDNVKEILEDIKSLCKIGWRFIKTLVFDGAFKLKDWYEIYSGN